MLRHYHFLVQLSLVSLVSLISLLSLFLLQAADALQVSVSVELPVFVSKITDLSPVEYQETVCQRKDYRLATTFLDPLTGRERYLAELPKLQHNAVLYGSPSGLLGLFVKDDVVRAKKKWYHSMVPRNLKDGHWESRLVQQSAVFTMGRAVKWNQVLDELQQHARFITNSYRYRSLVREAASFKHYYRQAVTYCRSLSPRITSGGSGGSGGGRTSGDGHTNGGSVGGSSRLDLSMATVAASDRADRNPFPGGSRTMRRDVTYEAADALESHDGEFLDNPLPRSLPSMMLVDRSVECTEEFFQNFAKHQAHASLDATCSPLTGLLKTHALGRCAGKPFDPLRRHAFLPPKALLGNRPYIFHWDTPLYRNGKFTKGLGGFMGSLFQPPMATGRLRVNLHMKQESDFMELLELILKERDGTLHPLLCYNAQSESCLVYDGLAHGLERLRRNHPSLGPSVQTLVLLLSLAVYRAVEFDSALALEWKPSGNGFPTVDRGGIYIGSPFKDMLESLGEQDQLLFRREYPSLVGEVLTEMTAQRNVRHLARYLSESTVVTTDRTTRLTVTATWLDQMEVNRVPLRTLVEKNLSNGEYCEYSGWRVGIYAPYYRVYRMWKSLLLPLLSQRTGSTSQFPEAGSSFSSAPSDPLLSTTATVITMEPSSSFSPLS